MIKIKTTKRTIKNHYKNIISVAYCNLWYLLRHREPKYYISSVFGWDCDIYQIDYNTCIVTGYRPFGNIRNSKLNAEYNAKAKTMWDENKFMTNYNEYSAKTDKLLSEYVEKILLEHEHEIMNKNIIK